MSNHTLILFGRWPNRVHASSEKWEGVMGELYSELGAYNGTPWFLEVGQDTESPIVQYRYVLQNMRSGDEQVAFGILIDMEGWHFERMSAARDFCAQLLGQVKSQYNLDTPSGGFISAKGFCKKREQLTKALLPYGALLSKQVVPVKEQLYKEEATTTSIKGWGQINPAHFERFILVPSKKYLPKLVPSSSSDETPEPKSSKAKIIQGYRKELENLQGEIQRLSEVNKHLQVELEATDGSGKKIQALKAENERLRSDLASLEKSITSEDNLMHELQRLRRANHDLLNEKKAYEAYLRGDQNAVVELLKKEGESREEQEAIIQELHEKQEELKGNIAARDKRIQRLIEQVPKPSPYSSSKPEQEESSSWKNYVLVGLGVLLVLLCLIWYWYFSSGEHKLQGFRVSKDSLVDAVSTNYPLL